MKSAIVLYQIKHLDLLDSLPEGSVLLSLDAEVDYELEQRGLAFVSGRSLQDRTAPDSYVQAEEMAEKIFTPEVSSLLSYRSVSLVPPLQFSIHMYLSELLHYVGLISAFADRYADVGRLLVPSTTAAILPTSGVMAEHEAYVIVEAVGRVAQSRSREFEVMGLGPVSRRAKNTLGIGIFSAKRVLFGAAISVLNVAVSLRPHRAVRVVGSDYWRNIKTVLRDLPDSELVLLDRSEAFKAGLANIWRYKIRFKHTRHYLQKNDRVNAAQFAKETLAGWRVAGTQSWDKNALEFRGVPLSPLLEKILTRMIERAVPRMALEVAGTYAMYKALAPHVVWLRASVSAQTHFSIMPQVAQAMGIPAIEAQHGIEYLGAGSGTKHHTARYIATYGALPNKELEALGYKKERLLAVGSPRFDTYIRDMAARKQNSGQEIIIAFATPTINVGERFGTYSMEEVYQALGEAVAHLPGAHLVTIDRSGVRGALLAQARKRGLGGVEYEAAASGALIALFKRADVFICPYSTVVYEAMVHGIPVVHLALAPAEQMMAEFHFKKFEDAGALIIARTPQELAQALEHLADPVARERMGAMGREFMRTHFSFDGQASKRLAAQLTAWTQAH